MTTTLELPPPLVPSRERCARTAGCWPRRRSAVGLAVLAADPASGYDPAVVSPGPRTASDPAPPGDPRDHAEVAPFGLPVLAELPELTTVLRELATAEAALARGIGVLCRLLEGTEVEATTGVGVEHWLAIVGRQTSMDRRLLLRACRLLGRLPALREAYLERRLLSFAQLRAATIALGRAPGGCDDDLDAALATLLPALDGADPDVVRDRLEYVVARLLADEQAATERAAREGSYLALQPRLDGCGGRVSGEFDAAGLAVLDAVTAPDRDQADLPAGRARADNLLGRLAGLDAAPDARRDPAAHPHRPGDGDSAADRGPVPEPGAARPTDARGRANAVDGRGGQGARADVKLIVRMDLASLLGLDDRPAQLLTTLTGGRLWLSAAAARRLAEDHGAALRSVVLDGTGEVLGVGRASRRPPGWLRDAILALHDTCTEAGCRAPARSADADHATPWWGAGDEPHGRTDLDNLGPLCPGANRHRRRSGWRVTQELDGARTWHHRRSGLEVTTLPAVWDPPRPDAGPVPGPAGSTSPPGTAPPPGVTARPPRGASPPSPGASPPSPGTSPPSPGASPPSPGASPQTRSPTSRDGIVYLDDGGRPLPF